MPFAAGDEVHVAALGTGVVREVRRGGRYLVELKGRSLIVEETALSAVTPRRRPTPPPAASTPAGDTPSALRRPPALDLHGMSVVEAIAAVDGFLNESILAGHAEARVIHGRSGGRLKAALHHHLQALPVVRAFSVDPGNPGATIIRL